MIETVVFRRGFLARPWILVGGSAALLVLLVALRFRSAPGPGAGDGLVLYCAAGLRAPVEEICAAYTQECGVEVRVEYGGSGALLSRLKLAPEQADVFLAAEESYVREARAMKLVAEILPVARQHVVIAVAPGNPKAIRELGDLLRADVSVALPNPELAAVGRVAQRALGATNQWEKLSARIKDPKAQVSLLGTVNEAAQAVKLGAADAAIVWDATARQFGLEYVEPAALAERATELVAIGVSTGTPRPTASLHFARYLTASDRGQPIFAKHFLAPLDDADAWEDRPEIVLMSGAMLKPAVDEQIKEFAEREGVVINTVYAGCGIHVAQMKAMKQGDTAPQRFPDAYFACDCSFMTQVQQWFDAAKNISRNDIVLAVAQGNPKQVRSAQDLTRPELRVGLGHPKNSALGAITDDLLKKIGLHEKVYRTDRKQPVVHTDAGHDLVNKLRVGALDLVVVYRSNVLSHAKTSAEDLDIVEMNLPEAIAIQPYAVAKDSQHKYLMRRLLEKFLSPQSHERFTGMGFHWVAEEPR
jgi:molybdenum ABC transporter molybdate-binding protein